jgi:hypothetical protein
MIWGVEVLPVREFAARVDVMVQVTNRRLVATKRVR